jgi:hypothetical protein
MGPEFGPSGRSLPEREPETANHELIAEPNHDMTGERHLPAERIADQLQAYDGPPARPDSPELEQDRAAEHARRALGALAMNQSVGRSPEAADDHQRDRAEASASAETPDRERNPVLADVHWERGELVVDRLVAERPLSVERIDRQLRHYETEPRADTTAVDDTRISAPASPPDHRYEPPMSEDQQQEIAAMAPLRVGKASEDFSVRGDPMGRIDDWQVQGHNSQRLVQTCAIATATQQANEVGIRVTQDDVLDTAMRLKLCDEEGAVKLGDYRALMTALGAHCKVLSGGSVESLASLVEHNVRDDRRHSVAITTNGTFASGYDPIAEEQDILVVYGIEDRPTAKDVNHAMCLTGVVRSDADDNHDVLGFLANDPARGPAITVDAEAMRLGWQEINGHVMFVSRPDDDRTA